MSEIWGCRGGGNQTPLSPSPKCSLAKGFGLQSVKGTVMSVTVFTMAYKGGGWGLGFGNLFRGHFDAENVYALFPVISSRCDASTPPPPPPGVLLCAEH